MLNFTFTTQEFGYLQLSFPDASIAPGIYEIDLLATGSSGCLAANHDLPFQLQHKAFINNGQDQLVLQINSQEMFNGYIEIYNVTGTLLSHDYLDVMHGLNEFNIDINNLKSGAYFYKIRLGNRFETGKIFIPGN